MKNHFNPRAVSEDQAMTLSEQLKSLMEKATPGPWATEYDIFDSGDHATAISTPGYAGQMGAFIAHCAHNWHEAMRGERRISWKEAETNASLIVTLVNNLPTILAALGAVEKHGLKLERIEHD